MWGRHPRLPAVLLLALSGRAADSPQSQLDYLAASLEKGDAAGALSVFDPKIGNFAEIKRDIEYLATLSGTTCDIKIELAEASGPNVALDGEWTLRLNPKQNGPLLVRTEKISVSMRQTEGEWKIVVFSPLRILAKPDPAIFDRIAALANDLTEGNSADALSVFSAEMNNYGEISGDVDALTGQTEVLCAIDVVDDNESAGIHKLDTDWYLQLKSDAGAFETRRDRVQIQMELVNRKWRITALLPAGILSPIKAN